MARTAPFCWNSKIWLDLKGWIVPNTCVDEQRSKNGCVGCSYIEDRPVTKYYLWKRRIIQEIYGGTDED